MWGLEGLLRMFSPTSFLEMAWEDPTSPRITEGGRLSGRARTFFLPQKPELFSLINLAVSSKIPPEQPGHQQEDRSMKGSQILDLK